ncbi:uncharacterized protein HD556DRAFT_1339368 [Suillus plorans]|uniref:Uncharacterized protein n=1 Tax=Suillus plorans TaxID=116603 RepID=A0A9P7J3S8_9AGAM|nr:uncharacterized protein HD556DRAFT_1339368 [Suillus plorans]KAG1801707.1 hypothetical protein HD556DRAFT_1339368 [Suillus plorans]
MGDAHGATALGWITLESTKVTGTDLHSKRASILCNSRDQAKVLNLSFWVLGYGITTALPKDFFRQNLIRIT